MDGTLHPPSAAAGRFMSRSISHVVGFDDAPFAGNHRGDVLVVGAVFSGARFDGVLSTRVRRDGANATGRLVDVLARSRFAPQIQLVMVQGIAFGGFNVIDLHGLHRAARLPVIAVARRSPDMQAIKDALLHRVRGGRRKWALIEALGPMTRAGGVYVQCVGLSPEQTDRVIRRFAIHSLVPEPLRTAHLIAAGVTAGESSQRV